MTQEELTTVTVLTDAIRKEQNRLSKLRDWITRITQEIDGMPHDHSYPKSSIEELTAQIVDCESNIQNLTISRMIARSKLTKDIDKLFDDNATKEVFVERYVFGRKFCDIAKTMNFSENRVYCLRRQGLKTLGIKKDFAG